MAQKVSGHNQEPDVFTSRSQRESAENFEKKFFVFWGIQDTVSWIL